MIKKVINTQDFDHLIFLGDIHRDFFVVKWHAIEFEITNGLYFQVGDFGIGFGRQKTKNFINLRHVNTCLKKNRNHLYCIRGNHDDPMYFEKDQFNFSNIHFVSDYTILSIIVTSVPRNIFCLGGAISIDRVTKKAKPYKAWWENENINIINNPDILCQLQDINIIATHNAPYFAAPFNFGPLVEIKAKKDPTLKMELMVERQGLSDMIDYIIENNKSSLKHYFYGHFHFSSVGWYKNVRFQLLDIGEFYEVFG